jgi:hypothetical protein
MSWKRLATMSSNPRGITPTIVNGTSPMVTDA